MIIFSYLMKTKQIISAKVVIWTKSVYFTWALYYWLEHNMRCLIIFFFIMQNSVELPDIGVGGVESE